MKTYDSLRSSFEARLDQLAGASKKIEAEALLLVVFHNDRPCEKSIAKLKASANKIVQCVHEISAYHNAMHTD